MLSEVLWFRNTADNCPDLDDGWSNNSAELLRALLWLIYVRIS